MKRRSIYYLLPTTYYLLPTAYYPLFTIYCLLLPDHYPCPSYPCPIPIISLSYLTTYQVPEEETVIISENSWLATTRYSDACDYVMQCMYEENTKGSTSRVRWFEGIEGEIVFYISRAPVPVSMIAGDDDFCFPTEEAAGDTALEVRCQFDWGAGCPMLTAASVPEVLATPRCAPSVVCMRLL